MSERSELTPCIYIHQLLWRHPIGHIRTQLVFLHGYVFGPVMCGYLYKAFVYNIIRNIISEYERFYLSYSYIQLLNLALVISLEHI